VNFFNAFLGQASLKDLFDIGIVALLVYQVLKIVHGTRAVQILIGIVFLSLLYLFGIKYNLYTINWILDHFFDYFFIIFIILFQDQLRAALATVGTGKKMFQFFDRSPLDFDVEEIVRSSFMLSKEQTGALIVLERTNGLQNYVETGTALDSELHSDLVYTIFQTNSPLHDGAIILKHNKIAAAGCFLPLSKNIEVDRNFGTRHRAALGISEVSDAIVVTVSEETGRVNVCIDGKFTACTNENELRTKLKEILSVTKFKKEGGTVEKA
jgi:diadenylate cyclase